MTLTDSDWMNDLNRLHYTIFGDPANAGAVASTLVATQAQMEAGTVTTALVSPARQQFHPSAAKFWVEMTYSAGVPSVTVGYNVTSLTDNGTGDVTINFTTAFSSASYCFGGQAQDNGSNVWYVIRQQSGGQLAASLRVLWAIGSAGTATDPVTAHAFGFGDQ